MSNSSPQPIVFSTDMLPERDRFGLFLEEFARTLFRIDIRREGEEPFAAQLRAIGLGSVLCKSVEYSPSRFGRTPDLLVDGNDDFMFHISHAVPFYDSLRDGTVRPGEAVLVSNALPSFVAGAVRGTSLSVSIPRKALMPFVPDAEDLARTAISADSAEMRLLRNYIATLLASPPDSLATLQTAGNHVLDLVALILGANKDAAQEAGRHGLREARLLALRQTVLSRLHEPGLSPRDVAQAHGISERYVRLLFEQAGTSFSDFLMEHRLRLAYRLLTDPRHARRRITDIAYEVGFADLSHFNHRFRRQFGDTPSGVRASAPRGMA